MSPGTPDSQDVCKKCTGRGGAHYLTCPTLRLLPSAPSPGPSFSSAI